MKTILFLVLCTVLTACDASPVPYQEGTVFSKEHTSKFTIGETTRQNVLDIMREPYRKIVVTGEKEIWIYQYTE